MNTNKDSFYTTFDGLAKSIAPNQVLTASGVNEDTRFTRFTKGKVRQTGTVQENIISLCLYEKRNDGTMARLTASAVGVASSVTDVLKDLSARISEAPADPYVIWPVKRNNSEQITTGKMPTAEETYAALSNFEGCDAVGIFQSGRMERGFASSLGQKNWFASDLASVDYSIVASNEKAVKQGYSTSEWNPAEFAAQVKQGREQVQYLERPIQKLKTGKYRVFLEPQAVGDLVSMFNWSCIGEATIQRKESCLRHIRSGERSFSRKFNLSDDLTHGKVPSFDGQGQNLPQNLNLIQNGKLVQGMCSDRTAKEYNLVANGASESETMTCPTVSAGDLDRTKYLKLLGTGIYLPQLHYLNWSDRLAGRITGMTRHACFWVENGEIVGPIENMRFDDEIFNLFGPALEGFTQQTEWQAETMTYAYRHVGGKQTPGALISEMNFPL